MQKQLSILAILLLLVAYSIAMNIGSNSRVEGDAASSEGISFNFIAYGDTRNHTMPYAISSLHDDIIDLCLQQNPELIIHTGDLALLGGNWTQLLEFNASMTAVWDSGVPFYSAPGNHEMYVGGWAEDPLFMNYTQYVHYEDIAAACGGTELYYSFDYGDVHFIILNTEDGWADNVFQCSSEQMTWLQGNLANVNNDTFLVAVFHRPAYSVREERPDRWAQAETIRDEFHSLFLKHDVDLVLTGHDHYYYRSLRDGIYYVVTGGGGAPPASIDNSAPAWQDGDVGFTEFHYCNVEVNSSHVTVDVHLLNGTAADSFTIPKPETTSSTTSTTTKTTIETTTTTTQTTEPLLGAEMVILLACVGIVCIVVIVLAIRRRK